MNLVSAILNIILGILGIVAFGWMLVGGGVGVVWLIVYMAGDKKKKLNVKKWIIVTFGGMILLPIVFIIYALFFVIKSAFGVDTIGTTLRPGAATPSAVVNSVNQ